MSLPEPPFTAVVLAAQRPGREDPVAVAAGVRNKSLAPLLGAPLITHVVEALSSTRGVSALRIVVEPQTAPAIQQAIGPCPVPVEFVTAADNLTDSVYAAIKGVEGPILVTTSDNVLLTPTAVRATLGGLAAGAEAIVAVARREAVLAAHGEGQRRFYRFADGEYSNCNLYAFSSRAAASGAEAFRSGGQFAKKPLRLLLALGPLNLALMLMGRLTLQEALRRVGRRLKIEARPLVLADGSQAIDVDNARTYRCAEAILELRRSVAAAVAEAERPIEAVA